MDATSTIAESNSVEAAHTAAIAKEAETKAISSNMMAVLEQFFLRGVNEKRFVDVTRIPFICDDISEIHSTLRGWEDSRVTKTDFLLLKQQSDLVYKAVIGGIVFILLAFMGGVTVLVFKK